VYCSISQRYSAEICCASYDTLPASVPRSGTDAVVVLTAVMYTDASVYMHRCSELVVDQLTVLCMYAVQHRLAMLSSKLNQLMLLQACTLCTIVDGT